MAAATYTTNLADIFTDGSTTGWTAIGTGGAALTQETDYFIQGTSCMSKGAFASATKGMIYSYGSDAGGSGTDGAYIAWMSHTAPNSLDTKAGGGMRFLIGSSTSDYEHYYVGGADTMTFLGWELVAVNEATAGDTSTGSPSTTVESYFGGLWDLPSGGPTKGAPNVIDGIRFGRCDAIIEFGDATPNGPADFDALIADLDSVTNRYGLMTQRKPDGEIENSGLVQFGTATNAVLFEDSNKGIVLRDHDHVTANFHTWEIQNASSDITMTNITVKALGTTSRGRWVTTDNATVNLITCSFTDMGTFGFDTGATITGCTFRRCDAVTHGGADMSLSEIEDTNVAANNSALIYDVATDPDGEMDGMSFAMGTTLTHAIEFGDTVPSSLTLRDCDFTGYSASQDNNASIFHFKDTSGTITLNLIGCTSDVAFDTSYRTDGATIVIVQDPVTTLVTALTPTGTPVQSVRVLLETKDGTGPLPFEESVSIVQTTGTATVTHTGHGLSTGQNIVIRGATQQGYNKVAVVTVTGPNAYTYSVDSGTVSPATGSPVASAVIIHGTTDVNGEISDSRTYASAQPVKGRALRSTTGDLYKTAPINGEISSTAGANFTANMILD